MAQSSARTGAIVVAALLVVAAGLAALHYHKLKLEEAERFTIARPGATPAGPAKPLPSATPKATAAPLASATPDSLAALGPLTAADAPQTVTLLKPEVIAFRRGGIFTTKAGTPLLFATQYVRDAKKGERFVILDYNPAERKVFLEAREPDGKLIALNTLDLHGTCDKQVPLPANTMVAFQGAADGQVLVSYQGDRIIVPVDDTDFVAQVRKKRGY